MPKNLYDGEIQINGKQNIDIPSEELYKDIEHLVQKNDFLIEGNVLVEYQTVQKPLFN